MVKDSMFNIFQPRKKAQMSIQFNWINWLRSVGTQGGSRSAQARKKAQMSTQFNWINWLRSVGTQGGSRSAQARKKAQMSIQFNWIFVLIAGGIILMFFVGVVMKQKGVSEQNLAATIVTDLDAIFTGAEVSAGTATLIDMPKTEIEVACDGFSISGVKRSLEGNIIFAPSSLEGRNLITWSQEWNIPYKVTNFLYLTTDDIRYIFVCSGNSDCEDAVELSEELPDEMKKEVCASGGYKGNSYTSQGCVVNTLKEENNYKTKLIFVGNSVSVQFPLDFKREDVSAIRIKDLDSISPQTNIEFYEKSGSSFSMIPVNSIHTTLTSPETIYAAIFAETPELYECMMRRAFEKLEIMSELYMERADTVMSNSGTRCRFSFDKSNFKNIIKEAGECTDTFPSTITGTGCDSTSIRTIINKAFKDTDSIESMNKKLQRNSCPLIY